jgi:soluble lytic murein transglycosylase
MIHAESKFKKDVVSYKGASGLMQIKKTTADWISKKIKINNYNYNKIFEPEINIQIGCWYVNNLLHQFGNYDLAICAYNAGIVNVSKWLKYFSNSNKKLFYIPFRETRDYLKKVNRNKKIYKVLIYIHDKI